MCKLFFCSKVRNVLQFSVDFGADIFDSCVPIVVVNCVARVDLTVVEVIDVVTAVAHVDLLVALTNVDVVAKLKVSWSNCCPCRYQFFMSPNATDHHDIRGK